MAMHVGEPRCKRRRIGSKYRPIKSATEATTYLDTLSLDDTSHLLQFCSEEPFRDDWASFILPSTLSTVAVLLPEPFKYSFRAICDQGCGCDECAADFWCVSKNSWFDCSNAPLNWTACTRNIMEIIKEPMPNIVCATLSANYSGPDTGALARRLTGCTELEIRIPDPKVVSRIISARGRALSRLAISLASFDVARAIATSCTELRCLEARFHESPVFRKVLKAVGPRLRELGAFVESVDDFTVIRENCGSLQSLILHLEEGDYRNEYSKLLASYGCQLRMASADYFDDHHARLVASSCPNAEIMVNECWNTQFNAFGSNLVLLRLISKEPASEVFDALSKCPSLREMDLTGFIDDPVDADLTKCDFSNLVCLKLFNDDGLDIEDTARYSALNAFAKCTGNLQRLHITVDITKPDDWSGLGDLVYNNPELTHVVVEVFNIERSGPDSYGELLPVNSAITTLSGLTLFFASLRQIRELIIETIAEGDNESWAFIPAIRNVLTGPLRFQRMHIRVLGQVYLPTDA